MLAMALKPFGVRSLVGLTKFPAALLTRPCNGPLSSQIRCTIASTAAASRMSIAWVFTFPPRDLAVSSSTPPRRPQIQSSAPSSTYLAAISLPRPVPPPVMRIRLPFRRSGLNTPSFYGCGLRRRVRSDAVAERPVLLGHLDQVDPRVLGAQAHRGAEVDGDAPIKRALLLERAPRAKGDLDDHQVARARDAEIVRVVDQVPGLVLGQELEAIERRHADGLHQRAVDGVTQLAPVRLGLTPDQRDADEGHGEWAWAWRGA